MDIIQQIFDAKQGDKDFILTRSDSGDWLAAIGNKSEYSSIGVVIASGYEMVEYFAEGRTAEETLRTLLKHLTVLGTVTDDTSLDVKAR